MKKRILIVEDDVAIIRMWTRSLEKLEVISATSISEAKNKFSSFAADFAAIILDGSVLANPESEYNDALTLELAAKFRKTYSGPMIAASSDPDIRKSLMTSGCSFQCDKQFVPDILSRILDV